MLGIAAEGITDQQTIENILIGYFKDNGYQLSSNEVYQAQPSGDATDLNNKAGYGSWTNLLGYLSKDQLKEDIEAYDYLILQVDSDICDKAPFNVPITTNGKSKPIADLVTDIVNRLIQEMNVIDTNFYDQYKDKIIFAISVHSIECWIYKYFEPNNKKATICKTNGCVSSLNTIINKVDKKLVRYLGKTSGNYSELTKGFRKPQNLKNIQTKDLSFDIFYKNLMVIQIPPVDDDEF